ncbi:alpha-lytic protease prodomain-containing protein [Streptomyces sp. NPDC008150]|uniref:S1 family peptidase n=1 Tax=Streptomyces sp. NPDC008150 TaxID=3364816 RepID=UPI0036E2C7E4
MSHQRHQRTSKRKVAVAAGAAVALGAAAVLLPHANASQDDPADNAPRTLSTSAAADLAARLPGLLGDSLAGAYYDPAGNRLVVNVSDAGGSDADTDAVEEAGAVVRTVPNSAAELAAAAATLRARATVPGTAWSVDPRTDKVRVTADSSVTGDAWEQVKGTVDALGAGTATVTRSPGTLAPFVSGGDAIFGGQVRCSLGFNVTAGDGAPAFLTAGHCVAADRWSGSATGAPVATVDTATFPGAGDFSLVRYDDPATGAPSEVNVGGGQVVPIVAAQDATVGLQVFRMGSTSGLHDGTVTGLNATVNYPEGTVTGLVQTDVCAEPGDSGGPLFTRDGGAVGLTSGGSGDCATGGETFFQPVTTALAATGATLGAGTAGADPTDGTPTGPAADPTAADPATASAPAGHRRHGHRGGSSAFTATGGR